MRPLLVEAFQAAVRAVHPRDAVTRLLRDDLAVKRRLRVGSRRIRRLVVALGKAAPEMAQGALDALGERVQGGLIVGPTARDVPPLPALRGGHPLPDADSARAGRAVLELIRQARASDRVLALISGGASASCEVPAPGVSLDDLVETNRRLLASGLDIRHINAVRRRLSALKGGRLAASCQVPLVSVVLSDVGEAPLADVGSGPTLPPPDGDAARVQQVLQTVDLPPAVRAVLKGPAAPLGALEPMVRALPGLSAAARAAREHLQDGGWTVHEGTPIAGPADAIGAHLAREAAALPPGHALVAAGESTVAVHRDGDGGRSQELALSASTVLDGTDVSLLAAGTDGRDGPTDAAGAVVDGGTLRRMRDAGLSPREALSDHRSHPILDAVGALLRTGPTGTQVGDLVIAVHGSAG